MSEPSSNTATAGDWYRPWGSLHHGEWGAVVDDAIPGWRYTGLRVADLEGGALHLPANDRERIIIPLAGSCRVTYRVAGATSAVECVLSGRASVFDGPSDALYVSLDTEVLVEGSGRIAVAEAPATRSFPPRYIASQDVPVELRGAGRSTRQVHNFGVPGVLDADRLIVCEVITPSENWSSYPPHKHDEHIDGAESRLEEIYYFETAVARGSEVSAQGTDPIGYVRNYSSSAGAVETLAEVRSGDVALVPYGWHGPCMAAPGYDLYYLNVMAGPDEDRAWLITDDPAHAWVRSTWAEQSPDPRLPYTRNTDRSHEGDDRS